MHNLKNPKGGKLWASESVGRGIVRKIWNATEEQPNAMVDMYYYSSPSSRLLVLSFKLTLASRASRARRLPAAASIDI